MSSDDELWPELNLLFDDSDNSDIESDSDINMSTFKYDMSKSNLSYTGATDDDVQSFTSRFNDY